MNFRKSKTGILLALPILLGVSIFYAIPLFITTWYSFTLGAGGANFVGFNNYIRVWSNERFMLAMSNTLKFMIIAIPLIVILSLCLSLILNQKLKANRFFRLCFIFPMVVPVSATIMAIQFLFQDYGIINRILIYFNINTQDFLSSSWTFALLVVLYIWKNIGYNLILFISALQMISTELYDSANMDGATSKDKFFYITLPLIKPNIIFVIIISILNSFKSFREVFLLCGSNPPKNIYLLQHYINNNFDNLNYPRLSVASISFFAIIILILFFIFMFFKKNKEELYA